MAVTSGHLQALAVRFGTPFYVYDLTCVRDAVDELVESLPRGARIFYSLKANPHPDIVATCVAAGLGVEVSSAGEWSALPSGISPSSVIYSGPGKTPTQIAEFARRWGGYVTAESLRELDEIRRVLTHTRIAGILVRVNVTGERRGASLTMTGRSSQFGIDSEELLQNWPLLSGSAGDIIGFQFYAMSNQAKIGLLAEAVREALVFVQKCADIHGYHPRLIDLGGGFAAPFGRVGKTDLGGLRPELEAAVAATPAAAAATLMFESGRFVAATAGTLCATVLDVKWSEGVRYAVLDAGVHCVAGLQASGRTLPAVLEIEVVGSGAAASEMCPTVVTGPLCTPFDVLNRNTVLDVSVGDLVSIPNVGAYGLSASAVGFLSRPLPAEIVVDENGVVGGSRMTIVRKEL